MIDQKLICFHPCHSAVCWRFNKEESILKLENELYNPQPNTNHIVLEKIYSGVYQYKDYIIQKVDQTIKYRPFNYDWKIYKNERYIITIPTLERARQYFNSIEK